MTVPQGRGAVRPTMTVGEAAEYLGLHPESVRRWIDEAEKAGNPVAERERDANGKPVPRRHRYPFVDAVVAYKRLRGGKTSEGLAGG